MRPSKPEMFVALCSSVPSSSDNLFSILKEPAINISCFMTFAISWRIASSEIWFWSTFSNCSVFSRCYRLRRHKISIIVRHRFRFWCTALRWFVQKIIVVHCHESSVSTKSHQRPAPFRGNHAPSRFKSLYFNISDCAQSHDHTSEIWSFQTSKMQWSHGPPMT